MDRKALIRSYKATRRPMGVFRVRNITNGKSFIGTTVDLPSMLNRQRAQLRMGGHESHDLQRDWNALGPESFVFEVLDTLVVPDDPGYDASYDLKVLGALWFEKIQPFGDNGYHARPKER
ncbi:MAG: GIY-YIG nuclease family protein [Acidobacteria bacterium]|nr:GIY-YIG nuclease family protein [Acidobacteriota bacterium]